MKPLNIKFGQAVFGLSLAAVFGAALVSLAWILNIFVGGGGKPSNDPPVTGQGGSFGVHGNVPWSVVGSPANPPYYASAALIDANGKPAQPNFLNFRGVDINQNSLTNPVSTMNLKTIGNWKIVLNYRDGGGHSSDPTTLSICTKLDCGVNTNSVGNNIYLIGSPCPATPDDKALSGTFMTQTIDRGHHPSSHDDADSIFYDLYLCQGSSPLPRHDPRAHIYDVKLDYFDTKSVEQTPTYHCVDGACTIGVNYQKFDP